jgi:hypothetical protein
VSGNQRHPRGEQPARAMRTGSLGEQVLAHAQAGRGFVQGFVGLPDSLERSLGQIPSTKSEGTNERRTRHRLGHSTGLAHPADFLFAHHAKLQHTMPLQAGMRQVDGAFADRLVEVAAPDQYEVVTSATFSPGVSCRRLAWERGLRVPRNRPKIHNKHRVGRREA